MAAVFSEMRQLVPASQIGLLFGVHVMLLPLVLMLSVLMPKIHAALDVSAGEVVLVHRILGVVYARTIAPLEIVGSFYVDFTGRRSNTALAIEVERGGKHRDRPHHRRPTPDERIMLTSGDAAAEAAAVLNKALGRMGWIREPER